jgi:hypothetical protein
MAYTELQISNMALAMIGQPPITDIYPSDTSKSAQWCDTFYDAARNILLQKAPWSFGLKRAQLTEDTVTGAAIGYGWAYAYDLPTGFHKLWGLSPFVDSLQVDAWDFPYKLEKSHIYCNSSPVYALYFALETTPETTFTDDFALALAANLALKIAYPIVGKAADLKTLAALGALYWNDAVTLSAVGLDKALRHERNDFASSRTWWTS